ncbi:MAG: alkaline phosphatase family protein [Candidatus Acidiferrales bacterium]
MRLETSDGEKRETIAGNLAQRAVKRGLSIVVLIDALGWQYIEGRKFLPDWLPFRQPLRTVLGFSSGAIPTILTGELPAVTGHWNLFYYDPKGSPFRWLRFFRFLPDWMLDHRVARKAMKEMGRHFLGMGPAFECNISPRLLPWFNYVEKKSIYGRGGIGGTQSILDQLAARNIPHHVYSYRDASDTEILERAERDILAGDASFFFLYLSEMDAFLHQHCDHSEQVEERLMWYDRRLRRVFETARKRDANTTFTVISDHGMTPVREHYDLLQDIEALQLKAPQDYLAVYDSTMARFWFFTERARNAVHEVLARVKCGRILGESELSQLGVFFADQRYGETIFLLNPGWMISRSDFNGPGWSPSGMHGYHPDDPHSDAVFLSSRAPSFPMHSIQDVYRWMQEMLQK